MLDLKVIYANGQPDDIRVRRILERGEPTLPLDLRGRDRSVDSIELVYRALPNRRDREPTVCVEGLAAMSGAASRISARPERRRMGRTWLQGGRAGSARIAIRSRSGVVRAAFKGVRLHVRGADVEMLDRKVIYTNGQP